MSHPDLPLDTAEKLTLNNDKAFAAWVLLVVGGASSVMLTLILTGVVASLPPLTTILADVALGLSVRAAYKWVGGWDWADWSIAGDATGEAIAADDLHTQPGATAGAMG
jgi:hypothetical protein